MILFCCASELGPPENLSAIEVILYYYYYYNHSVAVISYFILPGLTSRVRLCGVKRCTALSKEEEDIEIVKTNSAIYELIRSVYLASLLPIPVSHTEVLPLTALVSTCQFVSHLNKSVALEMSCDAKMKFPYVCCIMLWL